MNVQQILISKTMKKSKTQDVFFWGERIYIREKLKINFLSFLFIKSEAGKIKLHFSKIVKPFGIYILPFMFLLLIFSCSSDEIIIDPDNNPPGDFELISPKKGSTLTYLEAILEWEESIDPDGDKVYYDVYLGDDPDNFSNLPLAYDFLGTQIEISSLPACTKGYWKVVAKDKKGGKTSKSSNFNTRLIDHNINQVLNYEQFEKRSRHQSVVFNDKIWIIGGELEIDGWRELPASIWSSENGEIWTKNRKPPKFNNSNKFKAIVFRNKLFVMGEFIDDRNRNVDQVYSSEDGIDWVLENDDFPIISNDFHVVEFQNKLWIINMGYSSVKIWSSNDGINWSFIKETMEIDPRIQKPSFVVYNNKIWMIGGTAYGNDKRIYNSKTGSDWNLVTENPEYPPRWQQSVTIHCGKMWIMGGVQLDPPINFGVLTDLWYSEDGKEWIKITDQTLFRRNRYSQFLSFNNMLFIIGGKDYDDSSNLVFAFK